MRYFLPLLCPLAIACFARCNSGVRDLDFINKQFGATYNLDSTRTLDSTQLDAFRHAKAVYAFGEDGKGVSHIQMGMVSNDIPFTWAIKNDSLSIDRSVYLVRKENQGFTLVNNSVKLMLSQQP